MSDVHRSPVTDRHREAGIAGLELVAGLGTAAACGLLWALVAYYTEREFVYAALGVGLAVGFVVAATVKEPNVGHGVSAAGMSAIGLLLGKFLIVQWSLSGVVVDMVLQDPDTMYEAAFYRVATDENADPALTQWYLDESTDLESAPPELQQIIEGAFVVAAQMTEQVGDEEKRVIAKTYTDYISGNLSVSDKIKAAMSPWDLLFFGLAMFLAFQIGRGARGDDAEGTGGDGAGDGDEPVAAAGDAPADDPARPGPA
jgi:hypothetical protein